MTTKILYQCNGCGHLYESTDECLKCEDAHIFPDKIDRNDLETIRFDDPFEHGTYKYPRQLKIKMKDGSSCIYSYLRMCHEPEEEKE